jgi:CarboxypepD_reg-like domain
MKEGKKHINYSAEDIRRYLDAELSHPEMQAMEKAALEDPFLSDAIAGFEENLQWSASFESDMTDLQKRLSRRIAERKNKNTTRFLFSKWKIAASILFVLGLTLFTFKYLGLKSAREIAKNKEKDSIQNHPSSVSGYKDKIAAKSASPQTKNNVPEMIETANAADKENKSGTKEKTSGFKEYTPPSGTVNKNEQAKSSEVNVSPDSTATTISRPADSAQGYELRVPAQQPISDAISEKISESAISSNNVLSGNYIKGVVVDKKGKPIPFAPVKFKGDKKFVFTDNAGFFKLYMKDPRLAALIYVHPAGYEPVSAEIRTDSTVTNTIEMERASIALNEVVPLENDAAKKKSKTTVEIKDDSVGRLQNLIGWYALNNYILINKKIATADSLLTGEEIISFQLGKDGKLSSFHIEKSISPAHDAEIIRLIKSGPAIKLLKGRKQRCRVIIFFP